MSNVLDKSFIHRSYPKLAYGSIYTKILLQVKYLLFQSHLNSFQVTMSSTSGSEDEGSMDASVVSNSSQGRYTS